MKSRAIVISIASLMAGLVFGEFGRAQDFQKSYKISAEGQVRIWTISGEISIQGYNGSEIVVEGIKSGKDRDRVEILDNSGENRIDVGVRFRVRVPRTIPFNYENIRSVSGSVRLSDLTGHVRAESTSGHVTVNDVSGIVSATSISGNVDVTLKQVEGSGNMRFSSVSGNVSVSAPANLDALVEMSTLSGSLTTDYALEVQERRYGPGRSARGRLGAGTSNIRITSVSGRVSLTKG
jgi:DUF4097 and DUF4098 domain-containing protein YvlB